MNFFVLLVSVLCAQPVSPQTGAWRAWLDSPGGELPFGLELSRGQQGFEAWIINGRERIEVPEVRAEGNSVVLNIPHYDSTIRATVAADGQRLDGMWSKTGSVGAKSALPFHATHGAAPGFPPLSGPGARPDSIDGRWQVEFGAEKDLAIGVFEAEPDGTATGTFMTATGDYRFLAGSFESGRLRLSCFDGAHAFLFDARLQDDGTLKGDFWSRDSWHQTWTARRNPKATLPDPRSLTQWTGESIAAQMFPDLNGEVHTLGDPEFAGKVRIIEIFGTWCPNCHDAAAYLSQLHARYHDRGLRVIGIAFELSGDPERDAEQVRKYARKYRISYPLLLGGISDKGKASELLPFLDQLRSYPTIIFVDARDNVREIYQGFSGPATGEAYDKLRSQFEALIEKMLAEQ